MFSLRMTLTLFLTVKSLLPNLQPSTPDQYTQWSDNAHYSWSVASTHFTFPAVTFPFTSNYPDTGQTRLV
jgi:hypothetical protein